MENKKIQDLRSGDRIKIKLMIFQMNKGVTNKGAPYLSFVLQDSSGMMDAKYWNVKEEELTKYKPGMICLFTADVLSHNNQLQIRIAGIEILEFNSENVNEFVRSSGVSKEELKYKIGRFVDSIRNDVYSRLTKAVLLEYENEFYTYPAASKNHHNVVGGLATHVLSMLEIADYLANHYPSLDRDLLLSGVILHDLGKVIELSGPIVIEYTFEGKLLGHISIMQAKVYEIARRLEINSEEVTLLRHMILSHHGEYEYGSPVLPMTPEAEMLSFIDDMDAKMNIFEQAFAFVDSGNFTPRVFSMGNRSLYKAKNKI